MTEENKKNNTAAESSKTPEVTANINGAKNLLSKFKLPKVEMNAKPLKLDMRILAGIFVVMLVVVGGYYLKGFFVAAIVNGKPLTRVALLKELQKQGGKQVLESMVLKELLLQEAKKNNIVVSQAEIDTEMKQLDAYIAAQGTTLEQFLVTQNITQKDLVDGLKIKIIQDKLVAGSTTVTDAEVNAYIEENKASFPKDQDINTLKPQIMQSLQQQKVQQASQELLAKLKAQAKILYW